MDVDQTKTLLTVKQDYLIDRRAVTFWRTSS
jgi:hypothetical protein